MRAVYEGLSMNWRWLRSPAEKLSGRTFKYWRLTGGGALLRHAAQLTEFMTGMDTRIGYPNEHLAKDVPNEMASPMYSTGIGLVIEGLERFERQSVRESNEIVETGKSSKKTREKKERKPVSFLKKIQDFFENDPA